MSSPPVSGSWQLSAVAATALAVLFITAIAWVAPPTRSNALVQDDRLNEHVGIIADSPHPMGGEAHAATQSYIVSYLQSLGLEVEVQRETVVYKHPRRQSRSTRIGTVENIVATLIGSDGNRTIALMSHYDSVPGAPGAGDAAAGVAAVLEAAARLTSAQQPKNHVRFIITDGEERGLFGAQAYFNKPSNADAIDLVLNFEARGTSGPSMMFETSDGNRWLVSELNRAVPDLVATSLSYEIYQRMPNDTDATIVKAAGIPVLNFAFIGDPYDYHTTADNAANLDPDTLRQHATNAVGAALAFANNTRWPEESDNATYFNLLPGVLVQYGQTWEMLLAVGVLLLTLAALLKVNRGVARPVRKAAFGLLALILFIVFVSNLFETWIDYHQLEEHGITQLAALGMTPFALYVCITLGAGIWMFRGFGSGMSTAAALAPFAIILLACIPAQRLNPMLVAALVPAMAGLWWLRNAVGKPGLISGALVLWLVLAAALVFAVPKGAYVAVWPLGAMAGSILLAESWAGDYRIKYLAALLPGTALVLLIMAPTIYLFYLSLGIAMPQLPMMLMALVVAALAPLILLVSDFHGQRTGLCLFVVGFCLLFVHVGTSWESPRHPRPEALFMAIDAARGEYYWASGDENLSDWQKSVLGKTPSRMDLSAIIPNSKSRMWVSGRSPAAVSQPVLTLREDEFIDNRRRLAFDVHSQQGAEHLSLIFPAGTRYLSAAANGRPVAVPDAASDSDWRWRWDGLAATPGTLELEVEGQQPLAIAMVEVRYAMPATDKPRPADSSPRPYRWSDATVTYQTLELPQATGQ